MGENAFLSQLNVFALKRPTRHVESVFPAPHNIETPIQFLATNSIGRLYTNDTRYCLYACIDDATSTSAIIFRFLQNSPDLSNQLGSNFQS